MRESPYREPSSVPTVLKLDHVFEALAHPHRRYLLYTLFEETDWALDALAKQIAIWEADDTEDSPTPNEIEHLYISLYHTHVPMLAADDIVDFEEASETITTGPNAEQVLAVLENVGGSTDSQLETHARGEHDEGQT